MFCLIKYNYRNNQDNMRKTESNLKAILSPVLLVLVVTLATCYLIDFKVAPLTATTTYTPEAQVRSLYTVNSTRLDMLSIYCSVNLEEITQADRDKQEMFHSSLSSYFKANSTKMVQILFNSDMSSFLRQLQTSGIGTLIFISPYAIGLSLLLLVGPFLLCCCVCQETCPLRCCRSKNPNYTTGDLSWVTVVVVVTAILLAITAIPAFINGNIFFAAFNCRASQFLDNFENGNVTASGKYFFSGITTVRDQLSNVLSPALSSVSTEINKLAGTPGSIIDTAKTNAANAKASMQNMPNGGNNLPFILNYAYPLQSSSSTGVLPSVLSSTVGTFSDSSTLLGNLYSYVNTLELNLSTIATSASGVSPHLTAGDMGSQITAADTVLGAVQSSLDGIKQRVKEIIAFLEDIDKFLKQFLYLFYALVMAFGILSIIGVILVKSFNCIGFRFCLYTICFTSFFLGAILLLLAVLLATGLSTIYYTCDFLGDAFLIPTKFTNTIDTMIGSQYSDVPTYFSQCFGGTNDFITTVNPTLSGYISQLKTAVFNSAKYDFVSMTNNLNDRLSTMSTFIDNTGVGNVPDFDPNSVLGMLQIAYFNTVADKSLFTSTCAPASFPVFYQDAWVPGHSSTLQSYVSCQGKVPQDATICSAGIANTGTCPSSRCMNTFSIISMYYRSGNINNLVPDSNTRYGSACSLFNTYLSNFHNNYVKEVVDKIGNSAQDSADTTKMAGRFQSVTKTPVETLRDDMNTNVDPLFQHVYGNLTSTLSLDSVFNTETGVITGLDCRVLSENGVSMVQSLCITAFNTIFVTLVVVGIMSFGMFLFVCCLLCFNVRHHKYSLMVSKVIPVMEETDSVLKMS